MKLQAAVEYIIILGIVLAFLIPIWIYVSTFHHQIHDQLSMSYAENAAEQITSTADLVSSQGYPARLDISVYIPDNVENISIINTMIRIRVRTSSGFSDVFASSRSELNGTIQSDEGLHQLKIEAMENHVQITPIQ